MKTRPLVKDKTLFFFLGGGNYSGGGIGQQIGPCYQQKHFFEFGTKPLRTLPSSISQIAPTAFKGCSSLASSFGEQISKSEPRELYRGLCFLK